MTTDKKKAILKSAEFLFSTKGFNQTTVVDIANESGLHEASIYSYFSNKRNILFELNGEYLKNAVQTLNEHFQGMKEPGPKLRKSIWHFLYDMKNNPNYARLLMLAQRENPEFYASAYYKYVEDYVKILMDTIKAGQEEGLFRRDVSPRLIRNMAMGTSLFTTFDSIVHDRPYDPHDYSDIIYQLVINAVGAGPALGAGAARGVKNRSIKGRAESRRARILSMSTRVFANSGFSTATISEIAKKANLGDATLYGYFENKEAILLAISEAYMKELLEGDDIFFKPVPKTEKALRNLLWRWIWQLWTQPDFARILVLDLFRNLNFYTGKGYDHFRTFLTRIQKIVQQGQKEGIFREQVSFPAYFHMITGTIDQFLLPQLLLNRPPPGLATLNDLVDALVRAIRVKEGGAHHS